MAKRRGGRIINTARGKHPIGRLKSPITHLLGTAFQSQHMGDLSNQQTLHGASGKPRRRDRKVRAFGRNRNG